MLDDKLRIVQAQCSDIIKIRRFPIESAIQRGPQRERGTTGAKDWKQFKKNLTISNVYAIILRR